MENLEKYSGAGGLVTKHGSRGNDLPAPGTEEYSMNDRFLYEAEFAPDEFGGYSVAFPQLPEAITFGDDIAECVERAAEVLELIVAEYLDEGKPFPVPVFSTSSRGVLRVAVSVKVTPDDIERTKCVTASEAAGILGVSNGRVTHMLDAGVLQAVPYGDGRLVTLASVNDRLKNPKSAGRPRKELTPA
jgi:predicted RNase H-like HicB family nuclease